MPDSSGNIYAPNQQNLGQANQNFNNLSQGQSYALSNYSPSVINQATALNQQYQSNPYAQQAQTGANAASAYGTGTLTPQMQQGATSLNGLGQQQGAYVGQALQQGFDPQNALYNQNFQRSQDQQNAINSMNGVSGSPYAAGVSGQTAQNFNTDWNNQALARQQTAAGTAGALSGNAANAYNAGAALGTGAINTQAGAAGLPSSTYTQNIMGELQALTGQNSAAGGATDVTNSNLSQLLSYLGYGTGATNAQQQESDKTWQGIGSLLGMSTGGGGNVLGDALGAFGL